ncbi:MAG: type II toxin-antitoxin system HicA family toxin [Planctomycetaceae bacterium]
MGRREKLLERVLRGTSDRSIPFVELCGLLRSLSFDERVRGSHHIYTREGIPDIINIQPGSGGKAKPYQVKQVRDTIVRYRLADDVDVEEENGDAATSV